MKVSGELTSLKKCDAISEALLERIRRGVYKDRLPGRNTLAEEFRVNFKTANKAVSLLVERGVVYRKRGEGAFVVPRRRRSNVTLGLAYSKYVGPSSDPVLQSLFFGVNSRAKAEGCRLDISAVRTVEAPQNIDPDAHHALNRAAFVDEVAAAAPDGIILVGTLEPVVIEKLMECGPVIAIGQAPPGMAVDNVRRAVRLGVADAVRVLADRGHECIAYLSYNHGDHGYDLIEKEAGYAEAIGSVGLAYERVIRQDYFKTGDTVQKLLALRPRPTAVVAAESTLGLAVIRQAPHLNVNIPRDLALIAFDDGNAGLDTYPTMSSLQAFGEQVGRLAVEKLLERIDGKVEERIECVLPCELVERESSLPVPQP